MRFSVTGLATAMLAFGAFACKPETTAEKYSDQELRAFEQEQRAKLGEREQRLERDRDERATSAGRKLDKLERHVEEERAERPDEHRGELAELRDDIERDSPSPSAFNETKTTPDAGTKK